MNNYVNPMKIYYDENTKINEIFENDSFYIYFIDFGLSQLFENDKINKTRKEMEYIY